MDNVKKLFQVVVVGGALLAGGAAGCGGDDSMTADGELRAVQTRPRVPQGPLLRARVPRVDSVASSASDAGALADGGTCTGGCWLSWV